MIARHSGKIGDLVFSIPAAKALGVKTYLIPVDAPEVDGFADSVTRFLWSQGFETQVYTRYNSEGYLTPVIGHHFDVDLDCHRTHLNKGSRNMVMRYADILGLKLDCSKPWLRVTGKPLLKGDYTLVSVTKRHRGKVKWFVRLESGQEIKVGTLPGCRTLFLGTPTEHLEFSRKWYELPYVGADDVLAMAIMIRDAKAVFCNQTAALALAQGLGVNYYWERKTEKYNCIFPTEWQHELPV